MSSLAFTLVQSHLKWEDRDANLQMFGQKVRAIEQPTHVVILPEMFSTGFSMKPEQFAEKMDGPTITWMKKLSSEKRVILTGSVIIEENGQYFNRLIWMLPNGKNGFYDKRHLFAYGEEDQHYSAGSKRLIASVNGWKINLMVCYDLRFPVWARQQTFPNSAGDLQNTENVQLEYDVLIYVANWPERRSVAWKTLLRARAIENQCYVIGVNRVGNDGNDIYHGGDSMVIDPLGEVLYEKAHDEDVFTTQLSKERLREVREKYQFWRDADDFEILL